MGSKLSEMVDITFLYKDLLNMANSEGKGRYQIQGWPTYYADGGGGVDQPHSLLNMLLFLVTCFFKGFLMLSLILYIFVIKEALNCKKYTNIKSC